MPYEMIIRHAKCIRINRIIAVLILILVAILLYAAVFFLIQKHEQDAVIASGVETEIVRGTSMEPVLMDGEEIKISKRFYQKNPITRGDIVIAMFSWRDDPIVKFIRAVPGDSFAIEAQDDGSFRIMVNGEAIKNSESEFYALTYAKTRMLDLYINEFNGVIPEDFYLVLGNLAQGTQDSTQFGLVNKKDITGKVLTE